MVGVDVEFGDDEGVVEPALGAGGPQIGLDDGGPPLDAVVGQPVDEAEEPPVGGERAKGAGLGVLQVPEDDVAAYGDLVLAESEGGRLDVQGFVDARGQVDGADPGVGVCGAFSGGCHAGTLLGGRGTATRASLPGTPGAAECRTGGRGPGPVPPDTRPETAGRGRVRARWVRSGHVPARRERIRTGRS